MEVKNISTEQMDACCAAYYRSTGTSPNRAGLRSALHAVEVPRLTPEEKELVMSGIKTLEFNYGCEPGSIAEILHKLVRAL